MRTKRGILLLSITFSFALCLIFGIILLCAGVFSEKRATLARAESSGTCGENASWEIKDIGNSNYALIISGTGAMKDYSESDKAPWNSISENITSVTIGEKIVHIGQKAFAGCNITTVTIPASVSRIGTAAFSSCTALTGVTFADNSALKEIGENAFQGCSGLTAIAIPESVTNIESFAFQSCSSLSEMTVGMSFIENSAISEALGNIVKNKPYKITLTGDVGEKNGSPAKITRVYENADPRASGATPTRSLVCVTEHKTGATVDFRYTYKGEYVEGKECDFFKEEVIKKAKLDDTLTIALNAGEWTYGQSIQATLNITDKSNNPATLPYEGEIVYLTAYSYSTEKNAADDDFLSGLPQNAGTYFVRATISVDGELQYYESYTTETVPLTIKKAALTVKADDIEITYGDSVPTEYTVTYAGFVEDEDKGELSGTLSTVCEYNQGDDADTYSIIPSGLNSDNYEITYQNGTLIVQRATVDKPQADTTSFVYDGTEKHYVIADGERYLVSGTTSMTNAGSERITVELKDKTNYMWSDATTEDLAFTFTVSRATVDKPQADTTDFVYDKEIKEYHIAQNPHYEIVGKTSMINAGSETITVKLIDKANYMWSNGTTEDLEYTFTVRQCRMEDIVPDVTEFFYNGEEQVFYIPESPLYTVIRNKQTQVGEYDVTVSLVDKENYTWADGTTEDLVFRFVIKSPVKSLIWMIILLSVVLLLLFVLYVILVMRLKVRAANGASDASDGTARQSDGEQQTKKKGRVKKKSKDVWRG